MKVKRTLWKKAFSAFLAVLMLVVSVPVSVGAVTEASGTCGDNLTWSFKENGMLVISGSGDMYDSQPWGSYRDSIVSVVIENGVTNIGGTAFFNCTSLASVTIPDSVTSIGSSAFSQCYSLSNITIPEGMMSIGRYAFYCTSLTSITIPNSVTEIGESAFNNCPKLVEVINHSELDITKGSKDYGWIAYYAFEVHKGPSKIENKDDYLFYEYGDIYLLGYIGEDTVLDLPNIETDYIIYDCAFWHCSNLTDINLSSDVTEIGDRAFYFCDNLTNIIIPEGVIRIGDSAFYLCEELSEIVLPNGVTSIGAYAFVGCKKLVDIAIPNGVTNIGYKTFDGCKSLTSIIIPNGVTSIDSCFTNCTSLTSIIIPKSVTSIMSDSFDGCNDITIYCFRNSFVEEYAIENNITYVLIDENDPDSYFVIQDGVLIKYTGDGGDVVIPDDVISIGSYAFRDCTSMTSITIPNRVTHIGYGAFSGCIGLMNVTIPESVTDIDGCAFSNCVNLTNITIPNSVTNIGSSAFYGCTRLISITIPNGVTNIDSMTFYNCTNLSEIVIPNGVTSIGDYAFKGCEKLVNITIPDGVTYIGYKSFYECTRLTSVTIPYGVTNIGDEAFYYCTSLTNITIPDSVMNIGNRAFSWCKNLSNIIIPGSVMSIGDSAFSNCASSTSIMILDGVTSIGDYAFSGCKNLVNITIPDSVTSMGSKVLSGCTKCTLYTNDNTYAKEYAVENEILYEIICVESISISSDFKYNYVEGDVLDTTNGKITVIYNNGKTEVVDITPDMVSGFDSTVLGIQELTVTYENVVTNIDVFVNSKPVTSISVFDLPDKTVYIEGEELDITGLVVTAEYNDGTTEVVTDYTISGYDNTPGTKTITVTYLDKTATFTVEVIAREVTAVEITKTPDKTEYIEGEKLDLSGLEVTATYNDGTTEVLGSDEYTVEGFDSSVVGEQVITVTCNGKIHSFTVTVVKAIVYGDVTGEGKVNLSDVSLILKHIAKWDVELDTEAADVTGDGKVNLSDVSLILKYIAKWDVVLGPTV